MIKLRHVKNYCNSANFVGGNISGKSGIKVALNKLECTNHSADFEIWIPDQPEQQGILVRTPRILGQACKTQIHLSLIEAQKRPISLTSPSATQVIRLPVLGIMLERGSF